MGGLLSEGKNSIRKFKKNFSLSKSGKSIKFLIMNSQNSNMKPFVLKF